jgi:hypothetical protein
MARFNGVEDEKTTDFRFDAETVSETELEDGSTNNASNEQRSSCSFEIEYG